MILVHPTAARGEREQAIDEQAAVPQTSIPDPESRRHGTYGPLE